MVVALRKDNLVLGLLQSVEEKSMLHDKSEGTHYEAVVLLTNAGPSWFLDVLTSNLFEAFFVINQNSAVGAQQAFLGCAFLCTTHSHSWWQ